MTQALLERNLPEYDAAVVLDMCDEYRGLVKAGLATHMIVSEKEVGLSVGTWERLLADNSHLIIAKVDRLPIDAWKQVAAKVCEAARRLSRDQLICLEEAHFLAPQKGKLPDPIKHVATTGRGAGTSSIVVTQRAAKVDKTVLSQCQSRFIGGFGGDGSDLDKVADIVGYTEDLHNPQSGKLTGIPEELHADDAGAVSLRLHTDDNDSTIGSDWIYSDNDGDRDRVDSRYVTMDSTHYGQEGNPLKIPGR